MPESASFLARLGAFALDILLTGLVTIVLLAFLVGAGVVPPPDLGSEDPSQERFVVLFVLLDAPVDLAYFTLAEAATGRTVGKVAFGVRVVSARTGERPTLGQAALRNLLRFLWMVPPINLAFIAIDWYLMRVGEMDQRIGDLAARTFVVKEGAFWPPRDASSPA